MKRSTKLFVCTGLIIIALLFSAVICIYSSYKHRDSLSTEIRVLSQRHGYFSGVYEYDGELYSRTLDGIGKFNENGEKTEILKAGSEFFDYTISNDTIYLVGFGDGSAFLSTFSMNGEPLSEQQKLPVEALSRIGVVDNYLIGDTTPADDKRTFKVFDMENGLKETKIAISERVKYSRGHYSYGADYISAIIGNDGYFVCNNDFIKSSNERYLAANDKYFTFVDNIFSPKISCFDIESDEIKEFSNSRPYPYSKVVFAHLNGDLLTASFSFNHPNSWDDNDLLEGTDMLKYHRYDSYAVIDLKTGKVLKKHKFDTYERIIFFDDEKIMTWKQGKYTVYSADKFKKISEQDAPEIEADGSYNFFTSQNFIFVFDNNTNEIISKIPMN